MASTGTVPIPTDLLAVLAAQEQRLAAQSTLIRQLVIMLARECGRLDQAALAALPPDEPAPQEDR